MVRFFETVQVLREVVTRILKESISFVVLQVSASGYPRLLHIVAEPLSQMSAYVLTWVCSDLLTWHLAEEEPAREQPTLSGEGLRNPWLITAKGLCWTLQEQETDPQWVQIRLTDTAHLTPDLKWPEVSHCRAPHWTEATDCRPDQAGKAVMF